MEGPSIKLNLKSILKHPYFKVLLGTLIGIMLTNGTNWICNKINENENYLEFANRNKPIFKIINEPIIDSIIVLNDSSFINQFVKEHKKIFPFTHRIHIPKTSMKMKITFSVKNVSGVPGNYLGHSAWTFNEDNVNLRDSLIQKRMNAEIINFSSDAYLTKNEILPLSIDLLVDYQLFSIIHINIIYENDWGQIYDTYCWFSLRILDKDPLFIFKGGFKGKVPNLMFYRKIANYILLPYNKSPEYYVFSNAETDKIYEDIKYVNENYNRLLKNIKIK